MDIVTDLSAEAVFYITILQDVCKDNLPDKLRKKSNNSYLWDIVTSADINKKCNDEQTERIAEIIWSSNGMQEGYEQVLFFWEVCEQLVVWLEKCVQQLDESPAEDEANLYATPYFWRSIIREILYKLPQERIGLVKILHYMPLQVILVLADNKPEVYNQRLYQLYVPIPDSLLSDNDKLFMEKWWAVPYRGSVRRDEALVLLANDGLLLSRLNRKEIAVPFESLFNQELNEIDRSRKLRLKEREPGAKWRLELDDIDDCHNKQGTKTRWDLEFPPENHGKGSNDPLIRAQQMELVGLALSGGGIRSATFNLGLLQKLAEYGLLSRFDYLSTVSGGGYIGAWMAAWTKRLGSISRVTCRLDPKISADPLAEEVRPIRWLRMFSNYLTPNASIMSADSWTMGITWLRNTLINQIILLLLLLTGLALISAGFKEWCDFSSTVKHFEGYNVLWWSIGILIPGSVLAGLGMRAFDRQRPPQSFFNLGHSRWLSLLLIGWGTIASLMLTTWFHSAGTDLYTGYINKLNYLFLPSASMGFLGMLIIAGMGRYYLYNIKGKPIKLQPFYFTKLWMALVLSSALAAAGGSVLLAVVWQTIVWLTTLQSCMVNEYAKKMILICGIPMVLEVITATVVIRMALMGNLFPDSRREWWGRMGAIVHRFILLWLLITIGSLIIPDVFDYLFLFKDKETIDKLNVAIPLVFGSWASIVGWAVKLAFQSNHSGDKPEKGSANVSEIFIRFAPYLFMLGFLLIGSYTLAYLRSLNLWGNLAKWMYSEKITALIIGYSWYREAEITVVAGILTFLLSWRVGVNEFSLHHFYRNRLVRAYLGATRRRTSRENTANKFTGFDPLDDLKLTSLHTNGGYVGPYPLMNATLNASSVSELDRQDRKAESFVFTPLYCGFDFSPTRSSAYTRNQVYEYGYRPTKLYSTALGPEVGTAMAISGAAVSPNQGYHSNAATAFLLTVFNLRLGCWLGNPRLKKWKRSEPKAGIGYLIADLIGRTNINSKYVCLSDGGHFDDMGLYELIRRRCKYIILGDAEQDLAATCEGLANAIRRCRIDFGVEITLDVSLIINKDTATGFSKTHRATGTIKYPGLNGIMGSIIYIKTAVTGDEPVDILEYLKNNPEFPQQSTGDQFFNESQFESYRKLGMHSI